jgi:hypothetical protein
MHPAFELLDQALEMGRRELALLADGEVEQAGELSGSRDALLDRVLVKGALSDPASENLDGLVRRLAELKDLQARIIGEATRLHQDIGAKLRRNGQENKRFAGYGRAARPAPRIQSRFISRMS